MSQKNFEDFYEILQIKPDASASDIKKAWHSQMKKCHPDRNLGNREHWESICQKINFAYAELSNPDSRAKFDSLRTAHLEEEAKLFRNKEREEERQRFTHEAASVYAEELLREAQEEEERQRRENSQKDGAGIFTYATKYKWKVLVGVISACLVVGIVFVFLKNKSSTPSSLPQPVSVEKNNLHISENPAQPLKPIVSPSPIRDVPAKNTEPSKTEISSPSTSPAPANVQKNSTAGTPEVVAPNTSKEPSKSATPDEITLKFMDALKKKNMAEMESAIASGADINAIITDAEGNTPLHDMCALGDAECVKLLLDKGADKNIKNAAGKLPEDVVCTKGNQDDKARVFAVLLGGKDALKPAGTTEKPVDDVWPESKEMLIDPELFDYRFSDGSTPLLRACLCGDVEKTIAWIEADADVHAFDLARKTALHYACESKETSVKLLKILLEHGANPNAKDNLGKLPIHYLAIHGGAEELDFWLKNFPTHKDVSDASHMTPLCWAIGSRNSDGAEYLLSAGASLSIPLRKGSTLLHEAARLRDGKVVAALIKAGAKVNAKNSNRETPLCVLCAHSQSNPSPDDIEVAKSLMEAHASLSVKTKDKGQTPMHLVASGSNVDLAKVLLDSGANLQEKDRNGLTPKECAIRGGDAAMIKLLESAELQNSSKK